MLILREKCVYDGLIELERLDNERGPRARTECDRVLTRFSLNAGMTAVG